MLFSSSSSDSDSTTPGGSDASTSDEVLNQMMSLVGDYTYGHTEGNAQGPKNSDDPNVQDEESRLLLPKDDRIDSTHWEATYPQQELNERHDEAELPDSPSDLGPSYAQLPKSRLRANEEYSQAYVGDPSRDNDEDGPASFQPDPNSESEKDEQIPSGYSRKRSRSSSMDYQGDGDTSEIYNEKIDEEALQELEDAQIRRNNLVALKRTGKINRSQRFELIKLESHTEQLRKRLGIVDEFLEGCEGRKVSIATPNASGALKGIGDHELGGVKIATDDSSENEVKITATHEARPKKSRKLALNAAEAHARRLAKIEARTDKRNKKRGEEYAELQDLSNKRSRRYLTQPNISRANDTFAEQANLKLFELLRQPNPIEDSNRAMGPAADAAVRAITKKSQMTQLLASVPEGFDIHRRANDKREIEEAARRFGYHRVKAKDGRWLVKGMNTALLNHQLIAADWMLSREFASSEPYGGVVADAMGLGKTVTMLAVMAANTPSERDKARGRRITLIVVPASTISQWMSEIQKHFKHELSDPLLHFKASREYPEFLYKHTDIMITSYTEVVNSFIQDQASYEADGEETFFRNSKTISEEKSKLFSLKFFRVILDEAHVIKNHKSRTSEACYSLDSKYRWALSGTPIQNSVGELYPYFRFLRSKWTNSFTDFSNRFADVHNANKQTQLNVLISTLMIRRTYADEFLGRPLIALPEAHPDIEMLELSSEERIIYDTLEKKFRDSINKAMTTKTAGKNFQMYLVYIMRLRQAICHPFLLEGMMRDSFTLADIRELRRSLTDVSGRSPVYREIQHWCERAQGPDNLLTLTPGILNQGQRAYTSSMDSYLQRLNDEMVLELMQCKICGDHSIHPRQTIECKHVFCQLCIEEHMDNEKEAGTEFHLCPCCENEFSDFEVMEVPDTLENLPQATERPSTQGRTNRDRIAPKASSKSKRSKETGLQSPGEDANAITLSRGSKSSFLDACDEKASEPLVMSTKTKAVKDIVTRWQTETPRDKIIIFTQFTLCAKILGRMLNADGIPFLYYNGDLSIKERDRAVGAFRDTEAIKVMIVSLKCGGTALNLMWANRVISVDLYWNHSVEQQAFGRVFRFGQEKETHFVRLAVKDSIDERILKMQLRKMKAIDKALQDTGDVGPGLSLEEVAELFGITDDELDDEKAAED